MLIVLGNTVYFVLQLLMRVHPFDVHPLIIYSPYSNILTQLWLMLIFCVIELAIEIVKILTHNIGTPYSVSEMACYLGYL